MATSAPVEGRHPHLQLKPMMYHPMLCISPGQERYREVREPRGRLSGRCAAGPPGARHAGKGTPGSEAGCGGASRQVMS